MEENTEDYMFPHPQPELRPLLGEFAIQFEWVMRNLRGTIAVILKKEGLEDGTYVDIVLHDAQARSLRDYYIAVMMHYYHKKMNPPYELLVKPTYPEVKEFINLIHLKIEDAYKVRNTFLHSPWETMVVFDDKDYQEAVFTGERYSVTKGKGLTSKFDTLPSTTVFNAINTDLNELGNLLYIVQLNVEKDERIISDDQLKRLEGLRFIY